MSATALHQQLIALRTESAAASLVHASQQGPYWDDLRSEIEAVRNAYIGAAVTEIATLRAELNGRQVG